MRIQVRGGTADHSGRSLCESCRWSTVIRGVRLADEIVECSQLSYTNQRIPFPVASCSGYSQRHRPTLREMEEIAWVLKSDPRRNQIGFVHPNKLTEDERHVLRED